MDYRLDKTKFHLKGAVLFSVLSAILHPLSVVKTQIQVAGAELSHMNGLAMCKHTVKDDGVSGIFQGFGTLVVGTIPGRDLFLTSMEISKSSILKSIKDFKIPEATHVEIANGAAGLISSLIFESYFVPLDVVRWSVLPISLFFHSIIECILSFLFLWPSLYLLFSLSMVYY